jgi:SecD/SecF fusion protein
MQSKGAIRFLAIAFALVSLFQLSFTYCTRQVEKDARIYADNPGIYEQAKQLARGDEVRENIIIDSLLSVREQFYLDSMAHITVYNLAWIRKYTYMECKDREINLGLDLRGGMNVTLEVSVPDIIRALSGNSKDLAFMQSMALAEEMEKTSNDDFVVLFERAWQQINPNGQLASIFVVGLKDRINFNSSNEDVLKVIRAESNDAIDRTFNILRSRIDRFGVTQPNIQKLAVAGRVLIELPGIKDPARVRKLLQGSAQLEFWETYEYAEIINLIEQADKKVLARMNVIDTTLKSDTAAMAELSDTTAQDTLLLAEDAPKDTAAAIADQSYEEYAKEHPLLAVLQPNLYRDEQAGGYFPSPGPVVGLSRIIDTAKVGRMLRDPEVRAMFPREMRFAWTVKPIDDNKTTLQLLALRATREGAASLGGSVVVDARQDFDQFGRNEISMTMNSEGAQIWRNLTANNIKKSIAIVLDGYVYSFPTVQNEIPSGRSSISGNFTLEEAKDLANILKAGKLPAPARIVEEAIVGPTLGKEAINAGLLSMIIAFCVTLLYMILYYNRAGLVADIALVTNMFFIFGVLASLGAVLTLPGIAGIVLTIGMDVDKNVLIYERVREEIRAGKGIRLAINDGYKNAYSSIIDSNVITLLTAIVLYIFGSGPVQGFATTLIIGILSSLFCAIFITRLIFIWMMDRNIKINVWNRVTKNVLTKVNIDFIGRRKIFYVLSGILILAGVISISVRGLSYGIDFLGGRTYVVRFDQDVKTEDIRTALEAVFDGNRPEVKTFGPNDQVKITTAYMIDDKSAETDSIIETLMFSGLAQFYRNKIDVDQFLSHDASKVIGQLSSQKVEPAIAYSLLVKAYYAVFFSLIIIFLYILIRFKRWQWGVGAIAALFHDTLIIIGVFSLLYGIMPFGLEIDQHFIAAILTIIGYSIMDTVIIFDRVREHMAIYPKRDIISNMNSAINSTLSRTLNTSGNTLLVLLAMFIFGGEVIRGFAFALIFGIIIGTYSSIFTATPIAYDMINLFKKRKEKKALAAK